MLFWYSHGDIVVGGGVDVVVTMVTMVIVV